MGVHYTQEHVIPGTIHYVKKQASCVCSGIYHFYVITSLKRNYCERGTIYSDFILIYLNTWQVMAVWSHSIGLLPTFSFLTLMNSPPVGVAHSVLGGSVGAEHFGVTFPLWTLFESESRALLKVIS